MVPTNYYSSTFFRLADVFRVPPNRAFEVDGIEKPWMWKEPFNFIHSANLAQGIHNWPQYARRIYE